MTSLVRKQEKIKRFLIELTAINKKIADLSQQRAPRDTLFTWKRQCVLLQQKIFELTQDSPLTLENSVKSIKFKDGQHYIQLQQQCGGIRTMLRFFMAVKHLSKMLSSFKLKKFTLSSPEDVLTNKVDSWVKASGGSHFGFRVKSSNATSIFFGDGAKDFLRRNTNLFQASHKMKNAWRAEKLTKLNLDWRKLESLCFQKQQEDGLSYKPVLAFVSPDDSYQALAEKLAPAFVAR